ncbi:MAG: iron-containing alcohol dehydrogenase [Acidobacteriota bacterium]
MIGFRMPTRILAETGSLERLPEAARSLGLVSVLLVTDRGLRETEWIDTARRGLEDTGIRVQIFDEVEPNPRTTTATHAADLLRAGDLDGVVALGGGSAMDAAKAAAMLAENELRIEQYEGRDRYAVEPRPMIAIPTTCGTGSEVTSVSVLTLELTRSKISVKGESMFPRQALVDSNLIASLPGEMVAWTGLDALTHAIEAAIGTAANPVSNALADEAVRRLVHHLPRAAADPRGDHAARDSVMLASTLAGMAFANADVGAVHCLSESIGGLRDTPHGLTNAILLLPVLRYHRPYAVETLARLDRAAYPGSLDGASDTEHADHFLDALGDLLRGLAVPGYASLGVPVDAVDRLAEQAVRNGSNRSNPQPMSPSSYREILSGLA